MATMETLHHPHFVIDTTNPIQRLGTIPFGKRVKEILQWLKKLPGYRNIQYSLIATEFEDKWFVYENLSARTRALIEKIYLMPNNFTFVPRTVGKSKPSLYFSGWIPEHADSEVPWTYGLIIPLLGSDSFNFQINRKPIPLENWGVYVFDHTQLHRLEPEDYDDWLRRDAHPYTAIVGNIQPI